MADVVPLGVDQTTGQQRPLASDDTLTDSSGGRAATVFPVGGIIPFGGMISSVPAGWLPCDGSEYGRTGGDPSPEPELFSVIGTIWGVGDGSTTFNVPDFRARSVAGINDGTLPNGSTGSFTTRATGATDGAESHGHTVASHSHSISTDGTFNDGSFIGGGSSGLDGAESNIHNHSHSHGGSTGSASPGTSSSSNIDPTAYCPYIIRCS